MLTRTRITTAWAIKHGYKDVEEFKENAQKKFSLVETGIVHKPSCRMLLLNVCLPLCCELWPMLTWGGCRGRCYAD